MFEYEIVDRHGSPLSKDCYYNPVEATRILRNIVGLDKDLAESYAIIILNEFNRVGTILLDSKNIEGPALFYLGFAGDNQFDTLEEQIENSEAQDIWENDTFTEMGD